MRGIWSQFDNIPNWKRKVILVAFLLGGAGMLWEINDLVDGHQSVGGGPAGNGAQVRYDEFGDPYAVSRAPEKPSFSGLVTSPVILFSAIFVFSVVVANLLRNLVGSNTVLLGIFAISLLILGRGDLGFLFNGREFDEVLSGIFSWFGSKRSLVVRAFTEYLPAALAVVSGWIIGLIK